MIEALKTVIKDDEICCRTLSVNIGTVIEVSKGREGGKKGKREREREICYDTWHYKLNLQ